MPIRIADGDIAKAYDNIMHTDILDALLEAGCPNIIAAAWVRELRTMGIRMKLGSYKTGRIPRTKALFQGDPAAPFIFNHALDRPLFKLHSMAQRKKWGIPIVQDRQTFYCAIIAFADNYWILATSPRELQDILTEWLSLISQHGWHTPASEICYGTTALDSQYCKDVVVGGKCIQRVQRKVGFKCLGTYITFDTSDDAELHRRFAAAWSAFYRFSPLLKCKAIALDKRLAMLARGVHPAFLWCVGSLNLRGDQLPKVREVQRRMIRKMLHCQRQEQEDLEHFMERTNGIIKNIMARHGVISWDVLLHRSCFRWAGQLIDISRREPGRLTSRVFQHKDWKYIKTIAAGNHGRQLHGRRLRTWRWERQFYKYFGDDWQEEFTDKEQWREIESEFMYWCTWNR